jgi:hypothetical protein
LVISNIRRKATSERNFGMSKYIIKNCDAIHKHPVGHWNCANGIECQKREDCLLKQIVELCKKAIKDCDKCKGDPETDCYDCTQGGKAIQSDKILELLDIQEVE